MLKVKFGNDIYLVNVKRMKKITKELLIGGTFAISGYLLCVLMFSM